MLQPELRLIHLQLTRRCNLRCRFCGQWGEYGYMHKRKETELSEADWLRVVDKITAYRDRTGLEPKCIIWGGEPLLSKSFKAVVQALARRDFDIELVTNGVLLESFAEVINNTVETVYVSLDGPREVHERLRNLPGIYDKILRGVSRLNLDRIKLVNLFTFCEGNYFCAADFPEELVQHGFGKIIYQNLIYCSSALADSYRRWLKNSFSMEAESVNSWVCDSFGGWTKKLAQIIGEIKNRQREGGKKIETVVFPYELDGINAEQWFNPEICLKIEEYPCLMPFRHLQICADGNVNFCVDFQDFTLGDIRGKTIEELFHCELAQRFRSEYSDKNALCNRCPWFYNKLSITKEHNGTF